MSALAETSSRPGPNHRARRQNASVGPAIGSVFPAPPATTGPPCKDSLWATWVAGFRHVGAYGSARSALAAVLEFRGIDRVWLPAYCCPALADAGRVCEILWYGVDAQLNPDLDHLASTVRRGDAVLAIDYFGRAPAPGLAALAANRPDVLWIEDRAQALAPTGPAWADLMLYSPRKLVGVAEGGLLVGNSALPQPEGLPVYRSGEAQIARAADPEGLRPESWFPLFRAQEAAFRVDDSPMDDATRTLLDRIPAPFIAARRRANAALLATHLQDLALWPGIKLDFAPLAFPIRVPDSAGLAAWLAASGIYCARHWPDLPSDPARFPLAHRLAGQLLSLPCDQRYDAADMRRIVDAVREFGL